MLTNPHEHTYILHTLYAYDHTTYIHILIDTYIHAPRECSADQHNKYCMHHLGQGGVIDDSEKNAAAHNTTTTCCLLLFCAPLAIDWLIDSVVVICGLMVFGECVFVFVVVGLLRLHAKTGSDEWSIQNFYLSIYTLWASYSYQVEQMQFRCHSCLKTKYHLGPSCRRRSKNNSANMNYQNILSQDMSYRSHKIQKRNFVKRILYWLLFFYYSKFLVMYCFIYFRIMQLINWCVGEFSSV